MFRSKQVKRDTASGNNFHASLQTSGISSSHAVYRKLLNAKNRQHRSTELVFLRPSAHEPRSRSTKTSRRMVEVSGAYSRISGETPRSEQQRLTTINNETPRGNRQSRYADPPPTVHLRLMFFFSETLGQVPSRHGNVNLPNIQVQFLHYKIALRARGQGNIGICTNPFVVSRNNNLGSQSREIITQSAFPQKLRDIYGHQLCAIRFSKREKVRRGNAEKFARSSYTNSFVQQ